MLNLRLLVLAVLHIGSAIAAQPEAPKPQAAPLRPLHFGDINFLHTTDTHGWHAGHLLEPSFSADWGDYISLSTRLREKLEAEGKDLLVVDTGDRIEGNGLYDGDEPKGRHTFEIFKNQHIDIICSGNHELYKRNSSENEYYITAPTYHDAYIASNLDIYDEAQGRFVPLAPRFRKFTTKVQGLRILSFGFLYNFTLNYNNTRVTTVETTIKQQWFQDAINDNDVDLFVVIGHAGVRSDEFAAIFNAIRAVHPNILIQFFGGHVHVRDYKKFDSKSYGLASGRYLETIGFQSIHGVAEYINGSTSVEPTFFRRYIDNNLYSFYRHSGHKASTFHTSLGRNVSELITSARSALKLDTLYGCAPHDYWMNRVPYPSNNSIFSWLDQHVFPDLVINPQRADKPRFVMTNTGAIRFDIFKGAFTRDSTFIVSPFTSDFRYVKDVPYDIASKVLALLNDERWIAEATSLNEQLDVNQLAPPEQWNMLADQGIVIPRVQSTFIHGIPRDSLHGSSVEDRSILDEIAQDTQTIISVNESMESHIEFEITGTEDCIDGAIYLINSTFVERLNERAHHLNHGQHAIGMPSAELSKHRRPRHKITPGYTTTDDAGTDGDDTIHSPITFYKVPNVVQSYINPNSSSTPQAIDLVHNQYLQPFVIIALNHLGFNCTLTDVAPYVPGETLTSLMTKWSSEHWTKNC